MLHKSLTMAAAVLLLSPLVPPVQADDVSSRAQVSKLSISVFNESEVSTEDLQRAEARAGVVLREAGVQVTWIPCTPNSPHLVESAGASKCGAFAYPAHFSLRIVSRSDALTEKACGRSWLDDNGTGVYAAVSYSCVAASAQGFVDERELLGYVIVHEIGHLLLGPHAHSALGLMRAHWGPNELHEAALGNLYFSSHEEARLHSRLEAFSRLTEQSKHIAQSGK